MRVRWAENLSEMFIGIVNEVWNKRLRWNRSIKKLSRHWYACHDRTTQRERKKHKERKKMKNIVEKRIKRHIISHGGKEK